MPLLRVRYVLCGELDYVPGMCTLLPGCVIMPKFGCCKTVDHYFPGEAALAKKKDRTVCDATCCGGCYYETTYLKPFDCACRSTSRMCCCLVSEFALPCADDVPKTFFLYGLMLYPKVGCCIKVKDVMPAQVAPAAEKAGGAAAAAEAVEADAVAQALNGTAPPTPPRPSETRRAAEISRGRRAPPPERPPTLRFNCLAWP